jgi:signal transduction histidine kinase
VRALILSLMAMAGAVGAALLWPQELIDEEILAGGLALIPALLLAHYRGWLVVTILLGLGFVALTIIDLSLGYLDVYFGSIFILFVVSPYIAIALGAGWFGEIRRYQDELRGTQRQLFQSEKLDSIGRMAAGIAHEVKNPLMTILTGVTILSKHLGDSDALTRGILQDIADAAGRTDHVIGGLLNYSRDQEIDLAPKELNPIIEKSLLLVKHQLDKARIVVIRDLD